MKRQRQSLLALVAGFITLVVPAVAFAALTPTLNQTINAGTLWTDILQSDGITPVASPAVAFSATTKSLTCQTSTATLGDTNNKLYVGNLAANSGWTLSIAATGGAAATWSDGSGHTYKYNDATSSGCTNGQMTVNPAVGTVTLDCNSNCTSTNVSKGTSSAYISGSTDSVMLMSDSEGSGWKGYLTGVSLSQKIPASQDSGSYSLGMTLTIASP
jgi:hypothetical protein